MFFRASCPAIFTGHLAHANVARSAERRRHRQSMHLSRTLSASSALTHARVTDLRVLPLDDSYVAPANARVRMGLTRCSVNVRQSSWAIFGMSASSKSHPGEHISLSSMSRPAVVRITYVSRAPLPLAPALTSGKKADSHRARGRVQVTTPSSDRNERSNMARRMKYPTFLDFLYLEGNNDGLIVRTRRVICACADERDPCAARNDGSGYTDRVLAGTRA